MPVTTVLLAAGRSSRMGTPKLLLAHPSGTTWGQHLVSLFAAFGPVVVVTNTEVAPLWRSMAPDGSSMLVNPAPELGLFSSVHLALETLPLSKLPLEHDPLQHTPMETLAPGTLPQQGPLFLHPVDCPLTDSAPLLALLDALQKDETASGWFSPVYQGQRGHPSLLTAHTARQLLEHPLTAVLRDLLSHVPCTEVPVQSPEVLWNLNTPQDLERLWRADVADANAGGRPS